MRKFSFKLSHTYKHFHTRTYLSFLVSHFRDLTEHDGGVTVQKCDTGQTLTLLEGIDNHRVDRFKDDLGDFVGFQGGRTFELFCRQFPYQP